MPDNVMTLNDADNPAKECNPAVRYILPVRHALSQRFIQDIHSGKSSYSGTPNGIGSSKNHELRRLRDGYVYVFYDLGGPIWRQFRSSWSQPSTEPTLLDVIQTSRTKNRQFVHNFIECKWEKGKSQNCTEVTPTNKDRKPVSQKFINIPHKHVTKIWIGFTEIPWPAKVLYKMEHDPEFRAIFMSEENIEEESGSNVCAFREIENWKKITDFQPQYLPNKEPSKYTFQMLGTIFPSDALNNVMVLPEDPEKLRNTLCKADQKRARIIALRDDFAEAEEMANVHAILSDAYLTTVNENKYAVQIGSIAKNLTKRGENNYRTAKKVKECLIEDFDQKFNKIIDKIDRARDVCDVPVDVQNDILNRDGNLSCSKQILALNRLVTADTDECADVWEYACYQASLATLGMSSSTAGVAFLSNEQNTKNFWVIFQTAVDLGSHILLETSKLKLRNFELYITQHVSLFLDFKNPSPKTPPRYKHQSIGPLLDEIKSAFNVSTKTQTVKTVDELTDALKQCSENFKIGKNALLNVQPSTGLFSSYKDLKYEIDVPKAVLQDCKPTPKYQKYYSKIKGATSSVDKIGFLFNLVTLSRLLYQVADKRDPFSESFCVELVSSVATMLQGGADIAIAAKALPVAEVISSLTSKAGLGLSESLQVTTKAAYMSTLRSLSVGAGIVGVLVSVYHTCKSYQNNDGTGIVANTLLAIGSVCMLFMHPVLIGVGLALVLVAAVMLLFGDTPLETWAKGCFWGNGGRYLYWDQTRPIFQDQLFESYSLAHGDKTMEEYFDRELRAIQVLTGRIEIIEAPDGRELLLCPLFKSSEDCAKVKVTYFDKKVVAKTEVIPDDIPKYSIRIPTLKIQEIPLDCKMQAYDFVFLEPGIITFKTKYIGTNKTELEKGIDVYMRATYDADDTDTPIIGETNSRWCLHRLIS